MIDVVVQAEARAGREPGAEPESSPAPGGDIFALGRSAAAAAHAANGGRGVFARSRQLLASGAWRGPRDAAESYVEEEDLAGASGAAGLRPAEPIAGGHGDPVRVPDLFDGGDLSAAREAGVRTVLARTAEVARAAHAAGLRVLWRLPFRGGEPAAEREARLQQVRALIEGGVPLAGVIPTPDGEPMGLDTLRLVAACRLRLPVAHVVADFVKLGHRLAQMSLGFGADELFGPIMPERALRLGANAGNPVMTRKEAAMLLRGAGLKPHERLFNGELEEVLP